MKATNDPNQPNVESKRQISYERHREKNSETERWNEARIVKIIALALLVFAGLKILGASCKEVLVIWSNVLP